MATLRQDRDLWLVREGPTALARITAASIELFAEQGYDATSIRDIAARAGVSTAVIYHHLRSKREILLDIMARGQGLLDLVVARAVSGIDDPLVALAHAVQAHVIVSAVNQRTSQVIDREVHRLPAPQRAAVVSARDAYERRFAHLLAVARADGRLADDHPGVSRIALLQLLSSVPLWYSSEGELGLGEVTDALLVLALRMLGVDAPTIEEQLRPTLPALSACLDALDRAVQEVWAAGYDPRPPTVATAARP